MIGLIELIGFTGFRVRFRVCRVQGFGVLEAASQRQEVVDLAVAFAELLERVRE